MPLNSMQYMCQHSADQKNIDVSFYLLFVFADTFQKFKSLTSYFPGAVHSLRSTIAADVLKKKQVASLLSVRIVSVVLCNEVSMVLCNEVSCFFV